MVLVWFVAALAFHCSLQSIGTHGFNVDVGSAVVYDGPQRGQYFGYSVALHSLGNKRWVLVGAPLSNVSTLSGDFVRYGDVYKCEYPVGAPKACVALNVDNRANRKETVTINNKDIDVEVEEKSGQWLGGTVYSTGMNGNVLTCASRYIYRGLPPDTTKDFQYRWVLGKCFPLNSDLSGVMLQTLDPCYSQYKGNNYYGYCQAGFSAEYTADGNNVIMGAVGVTRWKGGLIRHSSVDSTFQFSAQDQIDIGDYMGYAVTSGHFSSPQKTELVGGAPRAENCKGKVLIYDILQNQLVVSSPLPQPKNIPTGTYFGSSLCAVDLDNDGYSDILVGAPYYTHVKDEGRVFIYQNNRQGALNLQEQFLEGDRQVNAHFGEAIASVGDLNKDGYQDVAIGAPLGGDDGSGAVYIYHGSSKGIESQYRQKIIGSAVKVGIKMFGLSISGGLDVDGNKYPDIAVGAYASDNAVIFRTNKIVNVEGSIKLSRTQINLEENKTMCKLSSGEEHQCFNMTVCFKYEDQLNIGGSGSGALQVKYTVELDKGKGLSGSDALRRMFFVDQSTNARQFVIGSNHTIPGPKRLNCLSPRTVYLMDKDKVLDVGSLLTLDLSFNLPPPPCGGLCPVLNDYLPNTYRAVASFQKQCKDQICVPDLAVEGSLVFSPSKYDEMIIGPVKEFTVQLVVSNKAEDSAYYSKVLLKYPADLDYVGPDQPLECDRESSNDGNITVTCNVGNPLLGNSVRTFGIKFTPGTIKKSFNMDVEATSQDTDANEKDNKKDFSVAVKFEADIEITGSSKYDQVVYSRTERNEEEVRQSLESIGPEVVQSLSIRNRGPSAVDGTIVVVSFPDLFHSSRPKSYLLYLLHVELIGGSGSCDALVNPENIQASNETSQDERDQSRRRRRDTDNKLLSCRTASCQSFSCSLGRLALGEKVEIRLTFRLWENTLLKELESPVVVKLETTGKVKVPPLVTQPNEDNDEVTIITTAKPASTDQQQKKTPWWVIFLSVLSGVILLGAVAALLYKLGFFKRKRVKDISGPMEEAVPMT